MSKNMNLQQKENTNSSYKIYKNFKYMGKFFHNEAWNSKENLILFKLTRKSELTSFFF